MEKAKYCYGCINPPICILEGPDNTTTVDTNDGEIEIKIAMCKTCALCIRCRKEERKNPNLIKHRIYWTVGCPSSEFELCQDVCIEHYNVEKDCPCSEKARKFHSKPYIYY